MPVRASFSIFMADALALIQSLGGSSGGSDIAYLTEILKTNSSKVQFINTSVGDSNTSYNPTGTLFYYVFTVYKSGTSNDSGLIHTIYGITTKTVGCGFGIVNWKNGMITAVGNSTWQVGLMTLRLD